MIGSIGQITETVYVEGLAAFGDVFKPIPYSCPECGSKLVRLEGNAAHPRRTGGEFEFRMKCDAKIKDGKDAEGRDRYKDCPKKGEPVAVGFQPGEPAEDIFALTERGASVVFWTRGKSAEARFTLAGKPKYGAVVAAKYGAVEEFLGVPVIPEELLPPEVAARLEKFELARSNWRWMGGVFRTIKEQVFSRVVSVYAEVDPSCGG